MGAVAITSQKQPTGSFGEPTPETVERLPFTRQQEIHLKEHYETQIRTPQDTHKKEMRALKQENKKLKNDIRVQKIINTKLRKNYATMVESEADLRTELQQVKSTLTKLQEDKDMEIIEIRHRREKRILTEKLRELKDFVRSLKMTNNNLKKDREERIKIQKQLEEELQTSRVINNKLQKKYKTVMRTEVKLRTDLERVKFDNDNQNKYWESKMKNCEEEKKILVTRSQELQKDMEETEIRHRRDKRILNEQLKEQRNFVRSLKMKNNNLKNDGQERMEIQKKLQEELQTLRVVNNKLQKKCETVMVTEVNLRTELERVKCANDNLNKYWESKVKDCEEEKNILVIRNQELQKELEAIQTNVPVQNLQLVGRNSQLQGRQRGIDTADDGKVSLHNFQFVRKLGKGAFGTVVLAKGNLPGGPELCAIKALNKRNITSSNICEIMAEKEALMLTSDHPFITTLYSCFQNRGHIFFVMEYMSGGDLKNQLDGVEVFSEKRTQFYAAEITLGVQFLHQHGILHRDLKLENVLLGSDGHCRIADFGLSKLGLFRHCKTRTQCGTPFYMAPEIVKNKRYGQGVDWWAVGIMIFEMLAGYPPFDYDEEEDTDGDNSQDNLDKKIVNDEVKFPEDMSLDAVSIVNQLLMKNPAERLGSNGSVDTVRQHPFFTGIDWQALREKRVEPPEIPKKPEEDNPTFSKVFKDDNTPCINEHLFEGLYFINYGVKRR